MIELQWGKHRFDVVGGNLSKLFTLTVQIELTLAVEKIVTPEQVGLQTAFMVLQVTGEIASDRQRDTEPQRMVEIGLFPQTPQAERHYDDIRQRQGAEQPV